MKKKTQSDLALRVTWLLLRCVCVCAACVPPAGSGIED